jgi:hypothetical protein
MERVGASLDGEIPYSCLTPEERAEADRLRSAVAMLRQRTAPRTIAPAVVVRVRECAAPSRPSVAVRPILGVADTQNGPRGLRLVRHIMGTMWKPLHVSFAFRPAYAAAAVLLAGLTATASFTVPKTHDLEWASTEPSSRVLVQFRLEAPDARYVRLAGSFSDWEPRYDLVEVRPGAWSVTVLVEPGVHDYAFLVDGDQWVHDPMAPGTDDGFGGRNSRLTLLAGS